LLIGNLGSHHTTIDVTTFRGFALSDDVAPFIVINDQDAQAAWSFTLLHELTHLWLGQTGVSGARAEQKIERFCNDVAGEVLLPIEELSGLTIANHEDFESVVKNCYRVCICQETE
jgi:Zn-dependent peptidase ImmA (M78 family)